MTPNKVKEEGVKEEFDTGNIGQSGCACGEVIGDGYKIETHCHRSGNCCPYAGVHYNNEKGKKHAEYLQKMIEEDYMCDCNLLLDKKLK